MPFLSDLRITPASDVTWQLLEDLIYEGKTDVFCVPEGYVTDFASVPRFLHWIVSPYGAYTRAAIVHDYLITEVIPAKMITSRDTDGVFRRIMQELGVPFAKRWMMWAAVRAAACFNSGRSYGRSFGKDALKVLAVFLVSAPFLLPGVIGVLISLGFIEITKVIGRWFS